MPDGQLFALLWGPFAIVLGTCFIVFRERISAKARAQYVARGRKLTPSTQSPMLMAVGGSFFVVLGFVVLVGGMTGAIH